MRKSRRVISKAKTYGFHPWVDQVDAIDLIVKETGLKESTILRKLIDEALFARRRKIADDELSAIAEQPATNGDKTTVQDLLLKLFKQNDTSLRMQDISLALIQETLAEARAGRSLDWQQLTPLFREQGLNKRDIAKRFDDETEAAKDFAYGVAQDVKTHQET
jgi:hypothetical protein